MDKGGYIKGFLEMVRVRDANRLLVQKMYHVSVEVMQVWLWLALLALIIVCTTVDIFGCRVACACC